MDIKRRHFLKVTSSLLVTGAVISFFPLSFLTPAHDVPPQAARQFQRLSSVLTANTELSPQLTDAYFNFLLAHAERDVFLEVLHQVETHPSQEDLQHYLKTEMQSHSPASALLKNITKMWYFGSYEGTLISANAYQQSLVWHSFGTTPPGVANGINWNKRPTT
jgi:hypothetical protein